MCVPLEPVNSSSSVASTHRTGFEWPSATEMHCRGAVRPPFTPPMGLITPLKITHANTVSQSLQDKSVTYFFLHIYRCLHCKTQVDHKHAHNDKNVLSITQRQHNPIHISVDTYTRCTPIKNTCIKLHTQLPVPASFFCGTEQFRHYNRAASLLNSSFCSLSLT